MLTDQVKNWAKQNKQWIKENSTKNDFWILVGIKVGDELGFDARQNLREFPEEFLKAIITEVT